MKAPAFWWRPAPSLAALALAPLGALYGAATAWRMRRPGQMLEVPVLCIGNLVAGGAGKTPAALAVGRLAVAAGRRPAFLSRGYGRQPPRDAAAVTLIDLLRHGPRDVGDEPLLLAEVAPTFVATDRRAAAQAAIAAGADCLILDDGLQNPALAKRASLAVVDGPVGVGNGLCLPAGPLRAPVARQWPAVSLLCVVGSGVAGDAVIRSAQAAGVPVTRATLVPDAATLAGWRGERLFAFAGIGRPQKLFTTLQGAGLTLAGTRAFPDHHPFAPGDLAGLRAAAVGARLVTTTKDSVRLPAGFAEPLPVELVFDEPARVAVTLGLSP